jgi:PKD repeat protein
MKKLILTLSISFGLMSCQKQTPVADMTVSKTVVTVGEIIEFSNLSSNCDISVINVDGEGTYNKSIRVGEDFEADDRSFLFSYDRPGEYIIKVIAENTSTFSGTNFSTKEIRIKVNPVAAKN